MRWRVPGMLIGAALIVAVSWWALRHRADDRHSAGAQHVAAAASAPELARSTSSMPVRLDPPAEIHPRSVTQDSNPGPSRADIEAVQQAREGPQPLDALRQLADNGNSAAAETLGNMLVACRPGALQDADDAVSQLMARAAWLRQQLGEIGAAQADRQQRLKAQLRRHDELAKKEMAQADAHRKKCNGVSVQQAWGGFDWLDRAVAMGDTSAMTNFVSSVVMTFSRPQAVGRNPDKALDLRDRASDYLSRMLQQCDNGVLQYYASLVPHLYALDDQRRLMLAYVFMHQIEAANPRNEELAAQEKQLADDALGSGLSSAQVKSARRQAAAMRAACLGGGGQDAY